MQSILISQGAVDIEEGKILKPKIGLSARLREKCSHRRLYFTFAKTCIKHGGFPELLLSDASI